MLWSKASFAKAVKRQRFHRSSLSVCREIVVSNAGWLSNSLLGECNGLELFLPSELSETLKGL